MKTIEERVEDILTEKKEENIKGVMSRYDRAMDAMADVMKVVSSPQLKQRMKKLQSEMQRVAMELNKYQ